ncbi:MAG TPA: c-type cytochrome [Candidatus Acidoferrales bacterium]|nr:c-type cytochrome [Candidatus Acidoferrales bacterium]
MTLKPALIVIVAAFVVAASNAGHAEGNDQWLPSQPLLEGQRTFQEKSCNSCHGIPGDVDGQRIGPDLGRVRSWHDVMQLTSSLWNHTPTMIVRMREHGVTRPSLSPEDMGRLVAYLFYVSFFDETGDPTRGRELFEQKTCVRCHQIGGHGGTVGPRLDELKDSISSSFLAQALWNHGPEMAGKMTELGLKRPNLEGNDVGDIVAFIRGNAPSLSPLMSASAAVGSARAGRALFQRKGCVKCHAIDSIGGTLGPDLSEHAPARNVSEMAGELWNHGPRMWEAMQKSGVGFSKLSDQDMADLVAYLYFVRYMSHSGDATKGGAVFAAKGCTRCHADGDNEARPGPNLSASKALESPLHWAAAMWNHAPTIDNAMRESNLPWPTFENDEMRDLVAHLQSRRSK